MSWWPFAHAAGEGRSHYLLDIGGTSIAGAAVLAAAGKPPLLCYDKRVPITLRAGEAPEAALARALSLVCVALANEGAPALMRAGAPSSTREVLVAIDAPWQQTIVHSEERRTEQPFTFTRHVLAEMLAGSKRMLTEGAEGASRHIEQHVVGVRLNGYEAATPFGKSARRATLIILVSWIHKVVVDAIYEAVRRELGTRHPTMVGGVSLRYRVLSASFPHERDMLILDAAGGAAALSLVRATTLIAIREFPGGESESAWIAAVVAALKDIAASYPLPRTILLVADAQAAQTHAASLASGSLAELWFNDAPPRIVPVSRLPGGEVAAVPEALPDIRLMLMARYVTLPALQ